ncbi:pyruvate formate lyase activating enzyme [Desulfurobacterium pacificum]|uniref:Pyruvate formate lyase activating enzyme n=1 Tax=Desulfurobacterium pacificum TaxID=240166 RepID=A0ABY1NJT3_9BACT|nr:radical SAM protein [Desulfurobacterium pacificum]SMP11597.1 pyruvate formate lyase activating enzyme [Desulfurobacterium pacificum]
MKFSPFLKVEVPITFKDQPGVQSALFYTDIRVCNLNCYHCHNRSSYRGNGEKYTYEELSEKLEMLKLLGVELIIISGGEPTLEKDLKEGLRFLKEKGFKVRIDTNGTNPEVVKEIIEEKLTDGFAVDIKFPLLEEYAPTQLKRFKTILYSTEDVPDEKLYEYVQRVKKTKQIVEESKLPYNVFRTVRYPLLTESELRFISENVKSIPHQINPFYPVEE